MDRTDVMAYAVRVKMKRFGSPIDDIKLMDRIDRVIPKAGLYGVNTSYEQFCLYFLYMTRKQAKKAEEALKAARIDAKLMSEPCLFNGNDMTPERQEEIKKENIANGGEDVYNALVEAMEDEKEQDKLKAENDKLRQEIKELNIKAEKLNYSVKSLIEVNNGLTKAVQEKEDYIRRLQKKYDHEIEKLNRIIKELEDETDDAK